MGKNAASVDVDSVLRQACKGTTIVLSLLGS